MKSLPPIAQQRWGRTIQSMAPGTLGGTLLSARPYLPKAPYSFEESPSLTAFAVYEADTGVTTSGSDVTAWADQSGNGRDLGNANDTVVLTTYDGKDAVRFGGDISPLLGYLGTDAFSVVSLTELTVLMVCSVGDHNISDEYGYLFYVNPFSASNLGYATGGIYFDDGVPTLQPFIESANTAETEFPYEQSATDVTANSDLRICEWQFGTATYKAFVDGTEYVSAAWAIDVDAEQISLGNWAWGTYVSAAVFLDQDSIGSRSAWISYLAGKYGTPTY